MNLIQAFEIGPREIISLVGAGGKTTLMYALAKEFIDSGRKVVTTTTTKIMPPELSQSPLLIVESNEGTLLNSILNNINTYRHITAAGEKLSINRLKGISLSLIQTLSSKTEIDHIVIEADGASRKPIKAPNATEPVIPDNTTLLIPVIGVESIGCHLNEESFFRADIASGLLNIPIDSIVTIESIATLITHPLGLIKGCPSNARIIPLLNKIDLENSIDNAASLARAILNRNHPKIHRVILGQMMKSNPVKQIITG